MTISGKSKDLEYDLDNKDCETVHMIATPMPLHLALEMSTLDTRGWVMQEQLLSRRCLYFTSTYAYFQCSREIIDECGTSHLLHPKPEERDQIRGVESNLPSLFNNPQFSLQELLDLKPDERFTIDPSRPRTKGLYLPKRVETTMSSPFSNPLYNLQDLVDLSPERQQHKAFAAYTKLVEKYTRRNLTYVSDILDGISGLLPILNEYFQSDIISGLPASALDMALLWVPAARIPRRGCRLLTMENTGPDLGRVDRNFPSWSWAGWTGPVEYTLFANALEPLPMPLIDSYTIEVNGTLKVIPARISKEKTSLNPDLGSQNNKTNSHLAEAPTSPIVLHPSTVLQFSAQCVKLTSFTISPKREYLSLQEHVHSTGSQSVRHILDRRGKRCGLWWEQAGYVYVGNGMCADAESKMVFVGINQHEDTFRRREGPYCVEGEIRMFDEDEYPSIGKGSGLVNALVIDFDMGHAYAERMTVARIHVKAWEEAGPQMRFVQLV